MAELVECRKTEADPTQILSQIVKGGLIGVAVDAKDETVAGEVIDFAKFEEGHETVKC